MSTDKPSETPRTDEEVEIAKKYPGTAHGLWVSAEHARQLERELAAAQYNESVFRALHLDSEKRLEASITPSHVATNGQHAMKCPDPRGHLVKRPGKRCYFCGQLPPASLHERIIGIIKAHRPRSASTSDGWYDEMVRKVEAEIAKMSAAAPGL